MEKGHIYIDSIGIISRCAESAEELAEIVRGKEPDKQALPIEYTCDIPSSKMRRKSRYSKMACTAADKALKSCPGWDERDGHRIGTIISTGYGAVQISSDFSDSVVKGDPALCSPAFFSESVPNSCVGQICIINGLKGPSTVLAGGDPLEYSALLLETGKADMILTGSVEEAFPPLYESVASMEAAAGSDLSEGAAMMILRMDKTPQTYCEVSGFGGVSLGKCPYLHKTDGIEETKLHNSDSIEETKLHNSDSLEETKLHNSDSLEETKLHNSDSIEEKMKSAFEDMREPEVIFNSSNGTWFDEVERRVLSESFPEIEQVSPKKWFGETLGCGYMLNLSMAAAVIRAGLYDSILVTGVDMVGNYCVAMLTKCI